MVPSREVHVAVAVLHAVELAEQLPDLRVASVATSHLVLFLR
jgi:hypothetical protein